MAVLILRRVTECHKICNSKGKWSYLSCVGNTRNHVVSGESGVEFETTYHSSETAVYSNPPNSGSDLQFTPTRNHNLMSQSRIYLSPPHMSGRELDYIADVISSNWVAPVGPHLTQFERAFAERIGVKHALAVTTGTAALHLALRVLGLNPQDEVICSTFTFCASANPIAYEHAVPVFIDSEQVSWNMDPTLLGDELSDCAARGRLPKAIVVVDILGQSADMDPILDIASRYEIPVIEDAAEALGGDYKNHSVGTQG